MEKISLKVKILVQGMVPIEQFDIHQYVLNKNELQRDLVEENEDDFFFIPLHLIKAVMQESASKKAYFLTLDKENLDIYIPEKILEDKERLNSFLTEEVVKIVLSLERELKIITNMDICLPIVYLKGNGEKYNFVKPFGFSNSTTSNIQAHDFTDDMKKLLGLRLSKGISIDSLGEVGEKNPRFERALDFYYDSFISSNIATRFTLLFASLESLFNLNGKMISSTVSKYTTNILFLEKDKEDNIFSKMKNYYSRRSFYIHGNTMKEISGELEFDLREIVRKVLLIYWCISLNEKINDPTEMLSFIEKNNRENLSPIIKLFILFLEDVDYVGFYNEMLHQI